MEYQQLYSLTIRNEYFGDKEIKEDNCPDFSLIPTEECQQQLHNFRLVLKRTAYGIKVLTPVVNKEITGEGLIIKEPFKNIPENTRFSFWLQNENPGYINYTDLEKSFGNRPIASPIFSNKDFDGSGQLAVQELKASVTDTFVVPRNELGNPVDEPFILKHNPDFPKLINLHITLGSAQLDPLASELQKRSVDENIAERGFSMETIDGSKVLAEIPHLGDLHRPYRLEITGEPGVVLSYHGEELSPTVSVQKKNNVNSPNAKTEFKAFARPPHLQITLMSNSATWKKVVEDWAHWLNNNSENRNSFHIALPAEATGNEAIFDHNNTEASKRIETTMKLQPFPEYILGDYGLLLRYKGPERLARVQLLKTEASNTPTTFRFSDGVAFAVNGKAPSDQPKYNRQGNSAVFQTDLPQQSTFRLTYPVKPALPWGIFGRVEILSKEGFGDFSSHALTYDLDLRFEPRAFHWKYYFFVEHEKTTDDENPLIVTEERVEKTMVFSEAEFLFLKLDLGDNKVNFNFDTIKSRVTGAQGQKIRTMSSNDMKRLWDQLVEIEGNLEDDEGLRQNNTRYLLVSKTKISCRREDPIKLKLPFTDADLPNLDPELDAFSFDLPLVPPKNDEVKVFRLKSPILQND